MENPTWPTREAVLEILRAALSRQEQVDQILALFEPFRQVEIRGFLGSYRVPIDQFLKDV